MMSVNAAGRRTVLCVPAGDDAKLRKALAAGADEVVVDLEDAVAHDDKARARDALAGFDWPEAGSHPRIAVRVNAPGTPWCHRDLVAVACIEVVASVVVPKVESRVDVGFAERLLDGAEAEAGRAAPLAVQALVETAAGVVALADVVRGRERLESVIIGYADLAASLGRARGVPSHSWAAVRDTVLLHARAAGLAAVDGPYLGVSDDEDFRATVAESAALGFDAKWVIHPRQVGTVNEAFAPSVDEVDHATRVLATLDRAAVAGRGAAVVDGSLVDEAMAVAARRVLAKAGR